jgi:hypothetical protein
MALYILLIVISSFFLLVGILSLRVSRKKNKQCNHITYGKGVNKHLLQTGISIEHGMVISESGGLQAQSKTSEAQFDELLIK